MKKILIAASLVFFLAGFTSTYATVTVTNTVSAVAQNDDDPTAQTSETTEDSNKSTECSKKCESGEKKPCCKKEEEKSDCSKK